MFAIAPALIAFWPFALFAVAVPLGFHFEQKKRERYRQIWASVASQLGLSFSAGTGRDHEMRMVGYLRGISVVVDVHMMGSGDSKRYYTRYSFTYPGGASEKFVMRRQGKLSSIFGSLFGKPDLSLGDPAFDAMVHIDANDRVAVDRYLTPARRMAVLSLLERFVRAEVTESSFVVERLNVQENPQALTATIFQLQDIALTLSAPTDVDVALQMQKQGDLQDAIDHLHALNDVQDEPANTFTQLLEAEALVAAGEGDKADQLLEALPVFDPEIGSWRQVAKSHPQPLKAYVPPTQVEQESRAAAAPPPPTPAPTQTVSLDQQSVIENLFGGERLAHEAEQFFFDKYEGATIEWTGKVDRTRSFRSDRDFDGAGEKVNVFIGSRGDGKLVSNRIHAIVHLPVDTAIEREAEITFRGQLVRADRYMRNLFVANAELV